MSIVRIPATITWPGSGSPGVNVWHWRDADIAGGLQAVDYGLAIDALEAFYTAIAPRLQGPGSVVLGDKSVIINEDPPQYAPTDRRQIPLTSSLAQAPDLLQVVVGWRTAVATRSGRGRTFLGPLVDAWIEEDGLPNASFLNDVLTAAQGLIDFNEAAANGAFGVWSELDGVIRDFTGYSTSGRFSYLESRRTR